MYTSFHTEIHEKMEVSGTDVISIQGIHVCTCILWNSQQFCLHKEGFHSIVWFVI